MNQDKDNQSTMMTISTFGDFDYNQHPEDVDFGDVPILPTRNLILFPGVTAPIGITRESSKVLADFVAKHNTVIGVICQKDSETEDPELNDMEKYGVFARIINVIKLPNDTSTAIIQAMSKFRVVGKGDGRLMRHKYLSASVKPIKETIPSKKDRDFIALGNEIKANSIELLNKVGDEAVTFELTMNLSNMRNATTIINTVASFFPMDQDVKLDLLKDYRLTNRGYNLLQELIRKKYLVDLTDEIRQKARQEMEDHQKNAFLQEQLEVIKEELYGGESEDIVKLTKLLADKTLAEETRQAIDKEIDKLRRLNPQSPDYSIQYNFLDTLLGLPWGVVRTGLNDFAEAEKELDATHYGLEKVKERILEQLAVVMNNPDVKSPIICLVGPPGVGKTSIAKSVAKALGRDYQRISLGGLHDEAEIRGHRRTYIGAMPGRIISAMKRVDSSNPVLVLDEIDKVSADYKGDPASALLEVLDPEQNSRFHDNFIDLDFDLSKVLFIATANTLSTLSQPLIDRMEVIDISGYAEEEKIEIARRHLIGKVKDELHYPDAPELNEEALKTIIRRYTSESGVRRLEKEIASVYRKHLMKKLKGENVGKTIGSEEVIAYLGNPPFNKDQYEGNDSIGVVTGLAWTAAGGEILFIESTLVPGKDSRLTLTGNLGDVMKESATLALQYIKANSETLGIDKKTYEENNVHIHVPEGAVPKDGPSAGITLATAILSSMRKQKVKERVAMTGEITLRGKVLPVGGIKEKILAARRAGITTIILSEDNRKDVEDIPSRYTEGLNFEYVGTLDEVFEKALI